MNLGAMALAFKNTWKSFSSAEGVHHDYTREEKGPGHDLIFKPTEGGLKATASGSGSGIRKGDFIILSHPRSDATSRYRVDAIDYEANPPDRWKAALKFAPRQAAAS